MSDALTAAAIQMRRARWFDYAIRRFDLISFRAVADWLAREPDGITRNEARRAQALTDLEQSVGGGEFGPAREQRCIVWLPRPPRADMLGSLPLRLNYGQIVGMGTRGHGVTPDLHVPRQLCADWFTARKIPVPFWLAKKAEPRPKAPARAKVSQAQIGRDFTRWSDSTGRWPTKKEADHWAKAKGYSTGVVRPLQAAGVLRLGRPRKQAD
jgi:hypothetical protein